MNALIQKLAWQTTRVSTPYVYIQTLWFYVYIHYQVDKDNQFSSLKILGVSKFIVVLKRLEAPLELHQSTTDIHQQSYSDKPICKFLYTKSKNLKPINRTAAIALLVLLSEFFKLKNYKRVYSHTWLAYSSLVLWSVEVMERCIMPRSFLALPHVLRIWVSHFRLLSNVTPRYFIWLTCGICAPPMNKGPDGFSFQSLRCVHLDGLKVICHLTSHSCILSISVWSSAKPWSALPYRSASSAQSFRSALTTVARSLM